MANADFSTVIRASLLSPPRCSLDDLLELFNSYEQIRSIVSSSDMVDLESVASLLVDVNSQFKQHLFSLLFDRSLS